MKKFEYCIKEPNMEDGKIPTTGDFIQVESESFFGKKKKKTEYVPKSISETQWLDQMGGEGWELVSVLRNSMSYDLKTFYFKREINEH